MGIQFLTDLEVLKLRQDVIRAKEALSQSKKWTLYSLNLPSL